MTPLQLLSYSTGLVWGAMLDVAGNDDSRGIKAMDGWHERQGAILRSGQSPRVVGQSIKTRSKSHRVEYNAVALLIETIKL